MEMFKKINDYFKNATFISVALDVVKLLKDFFAWRFAIDLMGIFASIIVYAAASKFAGFIFLAYFIISLCVEIVRMNKERKKGTA